MKGNGKDDIIQEILELEQQLQETLPQIESLEDLESITAYLDEQKAELMKKM